MVLALLAPLPPRADLDEAMRRRAAASVAYVAAKAANYLTIDQDALAQAVERVRVAPQVPGVIARYYDLVFAVTANEFDKASRLLDEIIALTSTPAGIMDIRSFSPDVLGDDFERFQSLLFAESPLAGAIAAPAHEQFLVARGQIETAAGIVRAVDPSIYEDIAHFFHHIYVCSDAKPSGEGASFGGVTSAMVWGGTLVNIKAHRTPIEMVHFLVHEVTHALLFALSTREPLVLNNTAETYKSPLRIEPRPMDGIYHATIVCARLAAFDQSWLDAQPAMQEAERSAIETYRDYTLERFHDGCATIDAHGKLSDQGRELLERCRSRLPKAA